MYCYGLHHLTDLCSLLAVKEKVLRQIGIRLKAHNGGFIFMQMFCGALLAAERAANNLAK